MRTGQFITMTTKLATQVSKTALTSFWSIPNLKRSLDYTKTKPERISKHTIKEV
jgi:hypothetical protein